LLLPPSPRRSAGGSGSALKPLATCTSAAAAAAASVRTATMGQVWRPGSRHELGGKKIGRTVRGRRSKRECTAMHLRRVLSAGLVCGATCFAPASAPSALRLSSAVALRAPAGVRAGRCVSSAHAHAEHARCHRRVARALPPHARARARPRCGRCAGPLRRLARPSAPRGATATWSKATSVGASLRAAAPAGPVGRARAAGCLRSVTREWCGRRLLHWWWRL